MRMNSVRREKVVQQEMMTTLQRENMRTYADIKLSTRIHPVTGDVRPVKGEEAIINAVKNIILTKRGESPHNPTFGSNIENILFSFNDNHTISSVRRELRDVINRWEPRVVVQEIFFENSDDPNTVSISVFFSLVERPERRIEAVIEMRSFR